MKRRVNHKSFVTKRDKDHIFLCSTSSISTKSFHRQHSNKRRDLYHATTNSFKQRIEPHSHLNSEHDEKAQKIRRKWARINLCEACRYLIHIEIGTAQTPSYTLGNWIYNILKKTKWLIISWYILYVSPEMMFLCQHLIGFIIYRIVLIVTASNLASSLLLASAIISFRERWEISLKCTWSGMKITYKLKMKLKDWCPSNLGTVKYIGSTGQDRTKCTWIGLKPKANLHQGFH